MEKKNVIKKIIDFMKAKKGLCIGVTAVVAAVVIFLVTADIETVDQHEARKSEETNKRQEILARLDETNQDSSVQDLESVTDKSITALTEKPAEALSEGSVLANNSQNQNGNSNELTGSNKTQNKNKEQSLGETKSDNKTPSLDTAKSQSQSSSRNHSGNQSQSQSQNTTQKKNDTQSQNNTESQSQTQNQNNTQGQSQPQRQHNDSNISNNQAQVGQPSQNKTESQNQNQTADVNKNDSDSKKEDSESEYIIVQVEIICDQVLGNEELSTKADIPEDGVVLREKTAIKKGQTVYDALKAVCTDYNIQMTNRGSEKNAYITSIHNLKEKECGRYSGWKFKVNGSISGKASSSHKLEENDEVTWYYATNYMD